MEGETIKVRTAPALSRDKTIRVRAKLGDAMTDQQRQDFEAWLMEYDPNADLSHNQADLVKDAYLAALAHAAAEHDRLIEAVLRVRAHMIEQCIGPSAVETDLFTLAAQQRKEQDDD